MNHGVKAWGLAGLPGARMLVNSDPRRLNRSKPRVSERWSPRNDAKRTEINHRVKAWGLAGWP
eukprot:1864441-Prorocentrum_lima.AAC.1